MTEDGEFAEVLAAYDEALSGGRGADFLRGYAADSPERERLNHAAHALAALAAAWGEPPRLTSALEAPGGRVGKFQLDRELGRGGFGIVYLAQDTVLKRQVALKIPRLEVLGTAELRDRFLREAEVMAALDHPNIVAVHEAGQAGPVCYIASAYCAGKNLAEWLDKRKESVPTQDAARLVACLARAVGFCHAQGVLHRDLKPSNILLTSAQGTAPASSETPLSACVAKITDFGLSKLTEQSLAETRTSVILGTPLYMAPEQAGGRVEVGPAADVYALGAILYELLTGQPPFPGRTMLEVLDRVRLVEPAPVRQLRPSVPASLETICLKCLRKEPEGRYATAEELAADLERSLAGTPIRARRAGWGTSFARWSQREQRIADAGMMALVNSVCAFIPLTAGIVAICLGHVAGVEPLDAVPKMLLVMLLFCGSQLTLSAFTLAGHGGSVWAGVIATPLLMVYTIGIVFGFVDTGGYFYATDRGMQIILQAIALALLSVEWTAYLTALRVMLVRERGALPPELPLAVEPLRVRPATTMPETAWRSWSRRPQRIAEAGMLALVIGLVGLAPVLAGLSGAFRLDGPSFATSGLLHLLLCFVVPHFVIGWQTLRRKAWAIWSGVVMAPLMMLYGTAYTFGWINTGGMFDEGMTPAHVFLECIGITFLAAEWVAYVFALRAHLARFQPLASTVEVTELEAEAPLPAGSLANWWQAWSRQPRRIIDAGIMSILNAVCSCITALAGIAGMFTGAVDGINPADGIPKHLLIIGIFCVPQALLGWLTLRRTSWAIWAGAILAPLRMLYVTGLVFGLVDTGSYFGSRDRGTQLSLEALAMSLLAIEWAAYALALRAYLAGGKLPPATLTAQNRVASDHRAVLDAPLPAGSWLATLGAWSRHPQRVIDAGMMALLNCVCCFIPVMAGIAAILTGQTEAVTWEAIPKLSLIVLFFCVPQAVVGWLTTRRSRWGVTGGLIVTPTLILYASGLILGIIDTGAFFDARDQGMRLSLQTLAMSLLGIEWLAFLLAWRAMRTAAV